MKRQLFAVLVGVLALTAAPMLGCGGDPPPSANQDNQNQDNQDNDNQNNDNQNNDNQNNDNQNNDNQNNDDGCTIDADCEDEEGPHVCGPEGECQEVECTEDYHCEDDELCDDSDNTCEAIDYDCEVDEDFTGQIGGDGDHEGGTATTDPLDESAGLENLQTALDDAWAEEGDGYDPDDDDAHIVDVDVDDGIDIEGAVVTAVGYPAERNVWVADADAAAKIFRLSDEVDDDGDVLEDVAVGQEVSFTIEEAEIYNADPSIRDFSDWTVDDQDVEVPFIELGGDELDVDDHYNRLVRMTGQVLPASWDCGTTCHEMRYGDNGEHMSVFRAPDQEDAGDCFTFVGPVGAFPPFYSDNVDTQLDAENFSWYQIAFD